MSEELKRDQPETPQGDGLKKVGWKWYIVFNWPNDSTYYGEKKREEIELKATNEEEAIAEAKALKGKRAYHGIKGPIVPAEYEVIYKARLVREATKKTLGGADR